jgi:hypothetical protein
VPRALSAAAYTPGVSRIFVFNGDADGLCALQQLSLAESAPIERLVTGPKRRIALLDELHAAPDDEVTVLDLSFDVNRAAVERLLACGVWVRYFDHHYAGRLPSHPRFSALIDPSPSVCTSVLVHRQLAGRHVDWAIAGAFGDNLDEVAIGLAAGRPAERIRELKTLGQVLNYNAYGESEADLHFRPAELHARLACHADPLAFIREDPAFARLCDGYSDDLARAAALAPYAQAPHAEVYVLPDAPWARRVSGVLAGRLARSAPGRAHAVVSPLSRGGWQVSVRAPLERPRGAAGFCRRYPGGGGREAAGGINYLPAGELAAFAERFIREFAPASVS